MKKVLSIIAAFALSCASAFAQETWTCPNPECGHEGNTGKFCSECGTPRPAADGQEAPAAKKQNLENAYAKSDFVPGDEIFFDDDFAGEKLGEFPSRWDLIEGYAEVATIQGRKVIAFTDDGYGVVIPLMKEARTFLPDVFTLEFDLYLDRHEDGEGHNTIITFLNPEQVDWNDGECGEVNFYYRPDGSSTIYWWLMKPDKENNVDGQKDLGLNPDYSDYAPKDNPLKEGEWNHFAFSFNKRAFKGYINGQRVINIPIALAPRGFWIKHTGTYKYSCVSNVRIAKGAVPLYDRLSSDGRIVSYGITFETGKATLKPESMTEIARIAKLMAEHPELNFEVQGHCDNTGSDKVNDPLSQKRAEAVVAALVAQGIDSGRMSAVGKGSKVPVADNSTDEGRAKNRRVEFVKK